MVNRFGNLTNEVPRPPDIGASVNSDRAYRALGLISDLRVEFRLLPLGVGVKIDEERSARSGLGIVRNGVED